MTKCYDIARHSCAECGTTEAQTYVVTQLDPEDDSTRTEVCRSCDDVLRFATLVEELRQSERDTRPEEHADGEHWDRDEEEADVVADVYAELADKLTAALDLPADAD